MRPYRGATDDVPPPSREVALGDAAFWLDRVETGMERIESGHGTAHDQRVIHQGLFIAQRLLTYAEFEDPERWLREHPVVERVLAEARSKSLSAEPYEQDTAAAEVAHLRPHFERAQRDLEVLRLRLTLS